MGIFGFLRGGRSQQVLELAGQVAKRSYPTVWERTRKQAAGMRISEARGYIRARAAQTIAADARHAISLAGDRNATTLEQVTVAATARVVSLILHDLMNLSPRLAAPPRHAEQLRRAA